MTGSAGVSELFVEQQLPLHLEAEAEDPGILDHSPGFASEGRN